MIRSFIEGLARDEWNIGIVHQSIEDIVRSGIHQPVEWFSKDPWRILADPFCVSDGDDAVTIYAENLSHWTGRGEIWAARFSFGDGGARAPFRPHIAGPVHLSYPFILRDGDATFAAVESFEAGGLFLWRVDDNGWRFEKTLLDRPAVDSTFYRDDRYWWLFCTFFDDHPDERLHAFFSETLCGDWTPHAHNPIKVDRSSARPAGALFEVDGKLFRPSQNSSRTYGGSLMINHVVALTPETYQEVAYREIPPIEPNYPDGIHTISAAGAYTIIDGKRWHRGIGANFARKVSAKVNKVQRQRRSGGFPSQLRFTKIG